MKKCTFLNAKRSKVEQNPGWWGKDLNKGEKHCASFFYTPTRVLALVVCFGLLFKSTTVPYVCRGASALCNRFSLGTFQKQAAVHPILREINLKKK